MGKRPRTVGPADGEPPIQKIGRNREAVVRIGRGFALTRGAATGGTSEMSGIDFPVRS